MKALQYHGGIVFGKTVNKPYLLANTILSFMIVTLLEGLEFLCEMLTVRNLTQNLYLRIQVKSGVPLITFFFSLILFDY